MLRGLLRKDLHIFFNYTESEEGEHLGNSKVQGYEQIPLFYISTYNSPGQITISEKSELEFLRKVWDMKKSVSQLNLMMNDWTNADLKFCIEVMKPIRLKIKQMSKEFRHTQLEQPFTVNELIVRHFVLPEMLTIVKPTFSLVVENTPDYNYSDFIGLVGSLKIQRI